MGGDTPLGFAGSLLNVRVGDGAVRARYGYRNVAPAPSGLSSVHGLVRVTGYDKDYANKNEWVSFEDRGAGVRPYSVSPSTFARSEITNGGGSLDLGCGDWLGFSYNGFAYFLNPGATPSVYKHEVGNLQSFVSLQDTAYVDPGPDPTFSAKLLEPDSRPWVATDTVALSGNMFTNYSASVVGKDLSVNGYGAPAQDVRTFVVTTTFANPADFSGSDYMAQQIAAAEVVPSFSYGLKIELRISGVWLEITDDAEFKSEPDTDITTVARLRGVAGTNAVQGIRLTVRARPKGNTAGPGFIVKPPVLGGAYLAAAASTARPWDNPYRAPDQSYGVRYVTVGGTVQTTGIKSTTIEGSRTAADRVAGSCPIGVRPEVEATSINVAPWVRDEAGTSVRMQFVRRGPDGKWRIIGSAPNGDGQSVIDRYEEWQLASLPEAIDGAYVEPGAPPVFSSKGFVAGVPFKGWVVWFRQGGKENVQHSRVGDAEALYSPGDDPENAARGQNFTLADDFADEPLGGVQAGDAILIAGRAGIYGQSGNSPSDMTPTRKLPGSMGCAGRFAFARYRDEGGNYGIAWLDVAGEAVWFATASLLYSSDAQARPSEISLPIRGTVRSFLYEEQREDGAGMPTGPCSSPTIDLSNVRMDVDEATGSLWVVLGNRALVLRPPSLLDGQRQWERHEFALGSGTGPVTVCADPFGPASGVSEPRTGQTLGDWSTPGAVVDGPAFASAGSFVAGSKSRWLKASAFTPWTGLPAESSLSSLKLRVRHRSQPATGAAMPVRVAGVEILRGGATIGTLPYTGTVPTDWEDLDLVLDYAALGITVAQLNAGEISARIAYASAVTDANAYNASNWSVSYAYAGETYTRADSETTPIYHIPWPANPQGGERFTTRESDRNGVLAAKSEGTVNVSASWVGASGGAPAFACLSLDCRAYVQSAEDIVCTYSVNNFLQPEVTGSGSFLDVHRDAVAKRTAPMSGASGLFPVSLSASVQTTITDGDNRQNGVVLNASVRVQATVAQPDLATVDVQLMALIPCYVVPGATSPRFVSYTAFSPDRSLLWLRSSGHLDSAEWCPTCARYVEGSNRDGGLPMPTGHWETGRIGGPLRRLARAEIEREGFGPLSLSAFTDRATAGAPSSAPKGQRWARWGVGVQGRAHRVRVVVGEATDGIRSIDLVFQPVNGPGR